MVYQEERPDILVIKPEQPETRAQKNLWMLTGMIAILFTVMQVQHSLSRGQLALPVTYDDNAYFVMAIELLNRLYNQGLFAFLQDLIVRPPHSPTSVFTGLLGFLIFGMQDWAPAVIRSIFVFILLGFIVYLTPVLPLLGRFILFTIALTCPLAGHLVVESRPDVVCGLATACAATLILQTSSLPRSSLPRSSLSRSSLPTSMLQEVTKAQVITAVAVAIAFLSKPSISPITLLLLVTAALFATVQPLLQSVSLEAVSPGKLQLVLHTLLRQHRGWLRMSLFLVLPYYVVACPQIYQYIYAAIFSPEKAIWYVDASPLEHLLYYIQGPGGRMMFGNWGLILIPLTLLASWRAIVTQDRQSLLKAMIVLGLMGVAYLGVTIPQTKSPFLGMAFGGMILVSALQMVIYLMQGGQARGLSGFERRIGLVSCMVIATLSCLLWQSPWYSKTGQTNSGLAPKILYDKTLINQIVARVLEKPKLATHCPPIVTVTKASAFLNEHTLAYYLLKAGIEYPQVFDHHRSAQFSEHLASLNQSDYVVALSLDHPAGIDSLPDRQVQPRLLEYLRSHPQFRLIERFQSPASMGSGQVFLYGKQQACRSQ